jgi:hypothetical protein
MFLWQLLLFLTRPKKRPRLNPSKAFDGLHQGGRLPENSIPVLILTTSDSEADITLGRS